VGEIPVLSTSEKGYAGTPFARRSAIFEVYIMKNHPRSGGYHRNRGRNAGGFSLAQESFL